MNTTGIISTRLMSQQIAATRFKKPGEIVAWMGALQAQDYNMAKWAIGLRLPAATETTVDKAIDKGEIIRTHVMRPTWHFVAAADLHWMLELTAPKILASLKTRHKQLGFTDAIFKKSHHLIERALTKSKHLTRDELVNEMKKANIRVDEARASHLFLKAELEGLICSGAHKDAAPTYTLLQDRVPKKKHYHRDEALALLAKKYFNSHGPATLQDFCWWSGLTLTEARQALEMIKQDLIVEKNGSQTWCIGKEFAASTKPADGAWLLPAFDEFVISYKDRSHIMSLQHQKKAFSSNGIFWPVMVVNGQVTGLWKRTIKKDKVLIETEPFGRTGKSTKQMIEKAAVNFGRFLNRVPELVHG